MEGLKSKAREIVNNSILSFKDYLEGPGETVTWERPLATIGHRVELDTRALFEKGLLRLRDDLIPFAALSGGSAFIHEPDGEFSPLHPLGIERRGIQRLPAAQGQAYTVPVAGVVKDSTVFCAIQFLPLVIERATGEALYPVMIGLQIKGAPPIQWSVEDKQRFWDALLSKAENLEL